MIYFDNNSTTPLAPEVENIYVEALRKFGNASSVHGLGQEARRLINESREKVAEAFHVVDSTMVFTSGGTESLNMALLGSFLPLNEKKHLIVSKVEHSSVLKTAEFLETLGVQVTWLEVDAQGCVDPASIEAAIRPETKMIAVMLVNNEIGNIYPIKKIGEIARKHGVLYLCDAVQAVGRMEINLSLLPIDLLAASAHKFHGPKGSGLLYIREGVPLTSLHHGGRQERGRRAGTENVPTIVATAEALHLALKTSEPDQRRIAGLRDRLEFGLCEKIPGLRIHGDVEHRIANTLNFRIEEVSGESLLMNLDRAGIAASSGAACDSGSIEPSHVLTAMGLKTEQASGGLRLSLSRYSTEAEVNQVLKVLPEIVEQIKAAA